MRRNLARALSDDDLVRIRDAFEDDWRRVTVVELDEVNIEQHRYRDTCVTTGNLWCENFP